jgi:hypothetical protein
MQTCYQGEKVTVRARGTDPVTKKIITDAAGTCYLFNPDADPTSDVPDSHQPMTFDAESRYYLAVVDTTGYALGVWTAKAKVEGGAAGYEGWEYTHIKVLP